MNNKILIFIFFILIGCKTTGNIKESNKENNISKNLKVKEVKIPTKKEKDEKLNIDYDLEDKSEDKTNVYIKQDNKKSDIKSSESKDTNKFQIKEFKLKEVEIEKSKELFISLKYSDWEIKSIAPNKIRLIKKENFQENSLFQFKTYSTGVVNIIFIRNDYENKIIWRQPYRINIFLKSIPAIKNKTVYKSKENVNNIENEKSLNQEKNKNPKLNETEFKDLKELADKYFEEMNYKDAKLLYLQLLEAGINDPEILYKLGIIEKENKNDLKASNYFKLGSVEKDSDYSIRSLIEYLKFLKNQKQYNNALDAYYKYGFIKDLDKKLAEELDLLLCDLLFCLKNYFNSAKEYRKFINNFPYSNYYAKALFFLAYSLERLPKNPDFKEAYRIYKIIIDRFPDTEYYLLSKNRLLYLDRHYLKVH